MYAFLFNFTANGKKEVPNKKKQKGIGIELLCYFYTLNMFKKFNTCFAFDVEKANNATH